MFIAQGTEYPTPKPDLTGTLWHCEKCDCFVSIHSAHLVEEPQCPVCVNEVLEFCMAFDSSFGQNVGDA
jgi:hypothetical protein